MAQYQIFQLTTGKGCSIMGMRIVICQHQKEPLFTNNFFFLLLIAPDITPVSSKNDAIKRLSSVRYCSYKKLQEGASLCPHEKFPIKHFLLQQESKQTKANLKNCVYLWLLPKQAWYSP